MMIMNPSTSSYRSLYTGRVEVQETARFQFLRKHLIKMVASIMVFILVFSSFLIFVTQASGTEVEAAGVNEQVVTVGSGDTLWSIASHHTDGNDIGYMVFSIKDRNSLSSETIHPGQILIIPEI
ncbi:LysM peptidoglycan-binding domain-containing protein [Paenibacillus sp. strain BS8-2]